MFEREAAAKVLVVLGAIYAAYYLLNTQSQPSPQEEEQKNQQPPANKKPVTSSDASLFASRRETPALALIRADRAKVKVELERARAERARLEAEPKNEEGAKSQQFKDNLRNFVFGVGYVVEEVKHEAKKALADAKHEFRQEERRATRSLR